MQFVIAAVIGALLQICASLVGRVLLALGISFVTYTGFDIGITALLNEIKTTFGGLPTEVLNVLAWLWLDKAIGLIFASFAAALVIKMAGGNTLTKMVMK